MSSLIPLRVRVHFPSSSSDGKSKRKQQSQQLSARSEPCVFAIFLTSNQAFIRSIQQNPPTYDSGRKPCHVLRLHTSIKDRISYEQACTAVLQSGCFRRVHIYTDLVLDPELLEMQQRLLLLCSSLHIHFDVTTAPNLENLSSPRTFLVKQCAEEEELEKETRTEKMTRKQILEKLDYVCEKMSIVLRSKLILSGGEPPEDMNTVFAMHDCWKQLYSMIRWEPMLEAKHTEQEDLEKQQLYYLEQGDFYEDVPL